MVKISGLKDINRALDKLPAELRDKTESAALRAGMTPVRKSAKANAASSKDSGLLQKSIGLNVRKNKKSKNYTARVGPRSGFRQLVKRGNREVMANPVKYAHLVELGTSHSAAKPFIRPAVESNTENIISEMAKGYDKGLTRAVQKLRKGGKR